ncbi:MAG: hypothetical protein Q9M28_04725, partial [Mariprofundaceae bacterium]|nr:hypothetical protein [Mariprofundaceae bacterium]
STAGTLANPFGIQATGNIDVAAQNSDVALSLTGAATLGTISANKADGTAFASLISNQNMNAVGPISANDYIHLETTLPTGTINAAAPASLTAKNLVTIAGGGVGTGGALNSNVDVFAANAGTGGVALINQKALTIGVVDGVTGVRAAQAVTISGTGGMTVANNVTSSAANVVLDAGIGLATVDNLVVNAATTVNGATGVTLSAGDNITLTAGSQLTGTNVIVTANAAGDGIADLVTGSATLAGNINGSAVTVAGGGVKQTGNIVSTGTVNVSAVSAPSSAIQGISLGSVQAAGQIDALSSNVLTLTQNVTSTAGPINLTAGNSAAVGDDLNVNANVTVNSGGALTMNAGDNMTAALGSQLTGTAIAMNSNVDGAADGVTGSTVLAGKVNGATVNITSGGLNHTGTITSAGLVNIAATSISAVQGSINLATVLAGGVIDVVSSHALTLNQNVSSTGGAINLTASNNVATVDNLTVNAVTVASNVGVNMTSGDNVTLVAGSQVNGTDVVIKADNAGDGFADTLTGGVTLAGNINSSTLNVTGGGLSQTGVITTTGLVNLAATSTAKSAIKGMSLATINAGGSVNALSNHALTLTNNVTSTAGPMNLTAGNSAAVGDDLTVNANVAVNSGGALTMNAGDNMTINTGSQLTGTAIVMNSDTDGIADGVTGSTLLAGNVTGTTLNMTGGGLNHTGTITTTGLVNIAANSTASSAIQGISLATVLAGGVIDVVSNHALILTQNVTSTSGPMNLTASNSAVSGDNITVNANVAVTSGAALNLNAGDNINTGLASSLVGTAIVLGADREGAAVVDGVTGSLTIAGNITGTTLNVTGGGLNHTGAINTTGLVNITATSTPTSAVQGISLATVLAGGVIDVLSNHALTLTQNVTSTAGPINLTAANSAAIGDDLTINANVIVNSGSALNLNAGDHMTTAVGSQLIATAAVTMAANLDGVADTSVGNVNLLGTTNAAGVIITGGGLNQVGTITSTGPVNVATVSSLGSVTNGISLGLIQAAGQTVSLSATGTPTAAILDNNDVGGLPALNIQAANLAMLASGGVGTALNAIETGVLTLASQGNVGGVNVSNTGNLTLGAVGAVPNVSASAGAINISTVGNLAINNAAVQGAGLAVSLLATGGSITETLPGLAADIVAGTLNMNVTGIGSTIGTLAQRLEIDATTLNATTQGGSMYVGDTAGGLSLGLVSTTQALGSVVDLLVTGGSLTQLPNAVANTASVISDTMNFAVTGVASTIGTANQYLNVDAITLGMVTTQGGDIFMVDTNGGVMIDQVSTLGKAGSQIALTSLNGSILESIPADPGLEFNAGTVNLQVNAPNTNIGTPLQPLEILASNIILNNLWGTRSFITTPAAGANVLLPAGQLNVPKFLPVINTPVVPSDLMLVGGNVVGGTNVAAFTQAQSALSSTVMPDATILIIPNTAIPTSGASLFALANLISGGSGYWGSGF